jgi:periplasmic mercuric ion binding protein
MTQVFFFAAMLLIFTGGAFAQKAKPVANKLTVDTFEVNGVCGMCKRNIEKAAKAAGAVTALWNEETHQLTVKYNAKKTSVAKIQKKIASVGYDNAGAVATQEAYDGLHTCCKYERKPAVAN